MEWAIVIVGLLIIFALQSRWTKRRQKRKREIWMRAIEAQRKREAEERAMKRAQIWRAYKGESSPEELILCRSDRGDGWWSLYAPWATDAEIASGKERYLVAGPGEPDQNGKWTRPNRLDYERAIKTFSAQWA